jgi:hypothetical protein
MLGMILIALSVAALAVLARFRYNKSGHKRGGRMK